MFIFGDVLHVKKICCIKQRRRKKSKATMAVPYSLEIFFVVRSEF